MEVNIYRIHKITFPLSLILCSCLFTSLFYKMATAEIVDDWSPYYSDIVFHIESSTTTGSYSLVGIIMEMLYKLPYTTASLLLSLFLTSMEILTIVSTYYLLLELDKVSKRDTSEKTRVVYQWLSLASIFIVSICIPVILPSFYFNAFNMTCWHNDTFLAMRPFAIMSLLVFIRIYYRINERLNCKELLLFSTLLLISTWMKPSFFMGFAPLLLTMALWCLFKSADKLTVFKRWFSLSLCTLPSVACMILQNSMLFVSGEGGNEIIIAPFLILFTRVTYWPLAFAVLLLFPVVTYYFHYKKINECPFTYKIIWLLWFFENLFGFILAESGSRGYDFNFVWGMTLSNGLLYLVSYYLWYNKINSDARNVVPFIDIDPESSKKAADRYYLAGGILLFYLIFVGIYYFALLYAGTSFAKL